MGGFTLDKSNLDDFRWDSGYSIQAGGSPNADEVRLLREKLKAEGERSPEHFRDLLVDCIVATAALSAGTIGRDCMTVILKPGANRIETLYVPATARSTLALPDQGPPAFSPWAILPGFIYAPAIVEGHQEWEGSFGLTYVVSGPVRQSGRISYGSQSRKPQPGQRSRARPETHTTRFLPGESH